MSLYIDLYLSDKKPNSTISPAIGATMRRFTGNFREPCDMMNPVVMLEVDSIEQVQAPNYNYASIIPFRRFYRITKMIVVTSELVQVFMTCDVLSTYRTEIANTRNYISRCSVIWDEHVIDTLQPTNAKQDSAHSLHAVFPHGYAKELAYGAFVVGIISPGWRSIGSVTYFVMNTIQLDSLITTLYNTDGWISGIDDVSSDLAKAIVNPMQYITSVEWFPFAPKNPQNVTLNKIGQFDIPGITCQMIDPIHYDHEPIKEYSLPGTIFMHPDSILGDTEYLSTDAYSKFTFRGAPFGEIQVPSRLVYGCRYVNFELRIDFVTGVGTLSCLAERNGGLNYVFTATAKISTSINLSQVINAGMANTFRNMTSSVGGITSGLVTIGIDAVNEGVTSLFGNVGILDAVSLSKNELRVTGTAGGGGFSSLFAYGDNMGFQNTFTQITEFLDKDMYGRPLCKTDSPANIGFGFYQMSNPRIVTHGTPDENDTILSHMRRGFYYE